MEKCFVSLSANVDSVFKQNFNAPKIKDLYT